MHEPPLVRPLVQLHAISKSFGGVRALDQVSWQIAPGEVHALCGENGAGKSTLIKVLTGVVHADEGSVLVDGHPFRLGNVRAAEDAGIAALHQESTVFPDLNAIDNIFVGREPRCWGGWRLDRAAMRTQAAALLARLGETIDVRLPVALLPMAQRQMVSMARSLARQCRLLIMDEPTASLSARETDFLFELIRRLRKDGVSVLYVSHRLEEVFAISDRITVLRDGRLIQTWEAKDVKREDLIRCMVGRDVPASRNAEIPPPEGPPFLRVEGLTRRGAFANIHLAVRPGEILGLGGLIGAGRSELARALFGIDRYDSGQVFVADQPLPRHSVGASLRAGIALVPEDRQQEGLILPMSIMANVSLAVLPRLRRWGWISPQREMALVRQQLANLQVKYSRPAAPAATLSGGNQQKLVLGKWLASQPRLLILDEPTRGVDVGAKAQFHQLIRQFAKQGIATLLISSDLPELLALSDRVAVMRQGRLVGELSSTEATPSAVLQLALPDGRPLERGRI